MTLLDQTCSTASGYCRRLVVAVDVGILSSWNICKKH